MNIDQKSLICFKKVAELEHITKAAQELFISQAQLSRIISDLEEQCSVKFFNRVGTGIKLNACGQIFYNYVLKVLALSENMLKECQEQFEHEQVHITIVTNTETYMPHIISAMRESHPNMHFQVLATSHGHCINRLKSGSADFAIVAPLISDKDLETTFLRKESAVVIHPPHHWLESYDHISLSDLKDEAFVALRSGNATRDVMDQSFNFYGFHPHYVVETNEPALVSSYVSSGSGIAIVPVTVYSKNDIFKNHLVHLDEPISGSVGLTWKRDHVFTPADEAFKESVLAFFESQNQLFPL